MLSTLLYCKDNKGLHYTVGKVRSNASIEINGEAEPRAPSTGKSCLNTGCSVSVFHKPRLAPPSLHFEGTSGTLKRRNNLRQPIVSGNPSSLVTRFQYWQRRQPQGENAGAEPGCRTPRTSLRRAICNDASSTRTGCGTKRPRGRARRHRRQTGDNFFSSPSPSCLPCRSRALGQSPTGRGANLHAVPCLSTLVR